MQWQLMTLAQNTQWLKWKQFIQKNQVCNLYYNLEKQVNILLCKTQQSSITSPHTTNGYSSISHLE